ncbi:hypothetical protein BGZ58_008979 [Dissophora ornata]|nr:hypothetical protein BGZ58_008979 [Dissophora ornata]
MRDTNANKLHRQAFQAHSSPDSPTLYKKPVEISARWDNTMQQHIILWTEVKYIFKDAEYILSDGAVVPFMTDKDFNELKPLRICFQPGVVLRVIIENTDHGGSVPAITLSATEVHTSVDEVNSTSTSTVISLEMQPETTVLVNANSLPEPGQIATGDHQGGIPHLKVPPTLFADLPIADTESMERGLSLRQGSLGPDSKLRRHSFNGLHDPYLQMLISNQMQLANNMGERFDRLHTDMDNKNKALQEQLIHMQIMNQELQQQLHDEQQKAQRELLKKQQQLMENQQQALDRLALIQSRVQTLLTQTYELHEYPIPRLFIILPREKRKRDVLGFKKLFRLIFLCECGVHTKPDGSKMLHEVHLAKHKGYDLEKPDEFLEKYGRYVLTMLQMVKYGFIAAGIAVPVLAHLKVIEGINAVQENLDFAKETFADLVDESINFVKDETSTMNGGINIPSDQLELDKQEVLEGADLRQLDSYLSVHDKGHALGNLYRIVTSDGCVKWVCMDHYHDIYQQSAINQLREIVRANKGSFVEQEGKLKVHLSSSTLAAQFYQALTRARCVQELTITLNWDVTRDDLQMFASVVTKAKVVRVDFGGCKQDNKAPEIVDSSLFQPILRLMSNGRIQIMTINISNKQFMHADVSNMKDANKLRVLSFDGLSSVAEGRSTLVGILENCCSLSSLSVSDGYANDVFQYMRRNWSSFRNLETLKVSEIRYNLTISLSQGRVETIEALQLSSKCWEVDGLQGLLLAGHLRSMTLKLEGEDEDKDRYSAILKGNPKLSRVSLPAYSGPDLDVLGWTVSARKDLLSRGLTPSLRTLDLWKAGDSAIGQSRVHFKDGSPLFDMNMKIRLKSPAKYDLTSNLYRQYGWSIATLDAEEYNESDINDFALSLDISTEKAGSKLESLAVNATSLTTDSLRCMDRIITRSHKLRHFQVLLYLDDTEWQEKSAWLFGQHGRELNALLLHNNSSSYIWTPEAAGLIPSRLELPELRVFEIGYLDVIEHADSFVKWIANMIGAPSAPQPQTTSLSSQDPSSPEESALVVSQSYAWMPLYGIRFRHMYIPVKHWDVVFAAIDFTALKELTFLDTQFTLKQLQIFVDCIPNPKDHETVLPLERLLFHCECNDPTEFDALDEAVARLKLKAPLAQVTGLPDRDE